MFPTGDGCTGIMATAQTPPTASITFLLDVAPFATQGAAKESRTGEVPLGSAASEHDPVDAAPLLSSNAGGSNQPQKQRHGSYVEAIRLVVLRLLAALGTAGNPVSVKSRFRFFDSRRDAALCPSELRVLTQPQRRRHRSAPRASRSTADADALWRLHDASTGSFAAFSRELERIGDVVSEAPRDKKVAPAEADPYVAATSTAASRPDTDVYVLRARRHRDRRAMSDLAGFDGDMSPCATLVRSLAELDWPAADPVDALTVGFGASTRHRTTARRPAAGSNKKRRSSSRRRVPASVSPIAAESDATGDVVVIVAASPLTDLDLQEFTASVGNDLSPVAEESHSPATAPGHDSSHAERVLRAALAQVREVYTRRAAESGAALPRVLWIDTSTGIPGHNWAQKAPVSAGASADRVVQPARNTSERGKGDVSGRLLLASLLEEQLIGSMMSWLQVMSLPSLFPTVTGLARMLLPRAANPAALAKAEGATTRAVSARRVLATDSADATGSGGNNCAAVATLSLFGAVGQPACLSKLAISPLRSAGLPDARRGALPVRFVVRGCLAMDDVSAAWFTDDECGGFLCDAVRDQAAELGTGEGLAAFSHLLLLLARQGLVAVVDAEQAHSAVATTSWSTALLHPLTLTRASLRYVSSASGLSRSGEADGDGRAAPLPPHKATIRLGADASAMLSLVECVGSTPRRASWPEGAGGNAQSGEASRGGAGAGAGRAVLHSRDRTSISTSHRSSGQVYAPVQSPGTSRSGTHGVGGAASSVTAEDELTHDIGDTSSVKSVRSASVSVSSALLGGAVGSSSLGMFGNSSRRSRSPSSVTARSSSSPGRSNVTGGIGTSSHADADTSSRAFLDLEGDLSLTVPQQSGHQTGPPGQAARVDRGTSFKPWMLEPWSVTGQPQCRVEAAAVWAQLSRSATAQETGMSLFAAVSGGVADAPAAAAGDSAGGDSVDGELAKMRTMLDSRYDQWQSRADTAANSPAPRRNRSNSITTPSSTAVTSTGKHSKAGSPADGAADELTGVDDYPVEIQRIFRRLRDAYRRIISLGSDEPHVLITEHVRDAVFAIARERERARGRDETFADRISAARLDGAVLWVPGASSEATRASTAGRINVKAAIVFVRDFVQRILLLKASALSAQFPPVRRALQRAEPSEVGTSDAGAAAGSEGVAADTAPADAGASGASSAVRPMASTDQRVRAHMVQALLRTLLYAWTPPRVGKKPGSKPRWPKALRSRAIKDVQACLTVVNFTVLDHTVRHDMITANFVPFVDVDHIRPMLRDIYEEYSWEVPPSLEASRDADTRTSGKREVAQDPTSSGATKRRRDGEDVGGRAPQRAPARVVGEAPPVADVEPAAPQKDAVGGLQDVVAVTRDEGGLGPNALAGRRSYRLNHFSHGMAKSNALFHEVRVRKDSMLGRASKLTRRPSTAGRSNKQRRSRRSAAASSSKGGTDARSNAIVRGNTKTSDRATRSHSRGDRDKKTAKLGGDLRDASTRVKPKVSQRSAASTAADVTLDRKKLPSAFLTSRAAKRRREAAEMAASQAAAASAEKAEILAPGSPVRSPSKLRMEMSPRHQRYLRRQRASSIEFTPPSRKRSRQNVGGDGVGAGALVADSPARNTRSQRRSEEIIAATPMRPPPRRRTASGTPGSPDQIEATPAKAFTSRNEGVLSAGEPSEPGGVAEHERTVGATPSPPRRMTRSSSRKLAGSF